MTELIAGLSGIMVGFIVLIVLFVIVIYNKLVRLRDTAQGVWSEIDIWLKKRYELVPNLVMTVKAHAAHEGSLFEKLSEAGYSAAMASSNAERAKAEKTFNETLKDISALAEAYPALKVDANFSRLQSQLAELENNVGQASDYYNATVRDLNNLIETFPSNVIASSFKIKREKLFETGTGEADK